MPPITPLNRVACGVSAGWVVGRESKGLITPQEHTKLRSSTFAKALYAGSRNHQIPLQQESVWEKKLLTAGAAAGENRQHRTLQGALANPGALQKPSAGCLGEMLVPEEAARL